MALTGMQIYKSLPKTNCKDCSLPTCMAFAMQVASKQRALTDCPHLTDEAKDMLSEASSPPMKLIKIGSGDNVFEFGQETVMFRHDEKFHRKCGIAVRISATLTDAEAKEKASIINKSVFERVGQTLSVSLCAIELDGCKDPAERVNIIKNQCSLPFVLITKSPDILTKVMENLKGTNPMIYHADRSNIEVFAELSAAYQCPLAIKGDTLENLEELSETAHKKGAKELILAFDTQNRANTLRNLTITRRASLKKNFRTFGFPAIVEINCQDKIEETAVSAVFAVKYGGIIMIDGTEPWELLPIMTIIQDVFTDPQVPNMVEAKLYEIGNPDENSPVFLTTNFSLTYFCVAGEVERSKIPAYICVVETEGLGVLNAYAGDKISAEKIVKTLNEQKVKEKVKHNKLIIPGLIPFYRAEIEDTSDWKEVMIGPETAREIPGYMTKNWK